MLAGAGISTSAGIPDFRSPSTGLYANLDRLNLPHPEAVFSLDFFQERPEPFWTLAKDLYPGRYFPTPTHYFFRLLHQKQVLLRVFTQNIDTLESLSGLDRKLIVEAHGSFATAHCLSCRREFSREYVLSKGVREGKVVRCDKGGCGGLVKPDIVFFGESLPESFWRNISVRLPQISVAEAYEQDLSKCDLLLIVGTSLTVTPFANLPGYVRPPNPRILINREAVGPFSHLPAVRGSPSLGNRGYDFSLRRFLQGGMDDGPFETDEIWQGDSDEGVRALADELGWREELEEMIIAGREELKAKWTAEAERLGVELPSEGTASPALSEGRSAAAVEARKVAREVKSVMRPTPPTSPPKMNDEPPDEEEAPEEAIRKLAKSIAENLGL